MKFAVLSLFLLCASLESPVSSAQRLGVLKRKKPEYLRNGPDNMNSNADHYTEATNGERKLFFASLVEKAEGVLYSNLSPPEETMSYDSSMSFDTSMSYETAEDHIIYLPANMVDDDDVEQSMSYETSMSLVMSIETEPQDVNRAPPKPSTFYTSIFSNGQQTRNAAKPDAKEKGRKMMQMEPTETIPDAEYVRRYLGNTAADAMEEQSMSYSMEYSMDYSLSYSMSMNLQFVNQLPGNQFPGNEGDILAFPIPDVKGTSKMPRPIASHPGKKMGKAPATNNKARRLSKDKRMSREAWTPVISTDNEPSLTVEATESISYSMSYEYGSLYEESVSYDYSLSYEYGSIYYESMSYDYSMSYENSMSYEFSLSMSISFGALGDDDGLGWDDDDSLTWSDDSIQGGALAPGDSSTGSEGDGGDSSGSNSGSGGGSNSGPGSNSNTGSGSEIGSSSNSDSGTGSGSGSVSDSVSDSGTGSSGGFTATKAPKGYGKANVKAPSPIRTSAAKAPSIPGLARNNARRRTQARRRRTEKMISEPKQMPWTSTQKPSMFLLESVKDMYQDFGAQMTPTDQFYSSEIEGQFRSNLCGNSQCGGKINMFKCLSCASNSWYSAISESGIGAVHGFVDRDNNIIVPSCETTAQTHTRLDIAVPMSGQDDKLRHFAARLGASLQTFRQTPLGKQMSVRLFVTKYQGDFANMRMSDLQRELSYLTKLEPEDITFIHVLDSDFSRANAINNLHRNVCQEKDCIVTVMDIDMFILPRFFYNAHEFVQAGHSAYFPIVWSEYNPETVKLVDDFYALNGVKQSTYSNHHGTWRQYGFGLYAISGADAAKFMLDERFKGWGGEDNDFYHRVSSGLNIVRMREHGLIHIFHSKECTAGSFVEKSMIQQCFGSKTSVEGSQLGLYLRNLRESDQATFNSIFQMDRYEEDVLLAVVTSRENLGTRVAAIRDSWGKISHIPANVQIRYFVGDGTESKFDLLRLADLEDADELVVMTEVEDNEYPPVKKNTNMLKRIQEIVLDMEASSAMDFKYIMKIDDDTYINFDGLLKFLAYRDPTETHQFWGERGMGYLQDREGLKKAGLKKPYCTGGPGYVLSRATFDDTVRGIDACVQEADISPYREYLWHSDVVIGMCVTKQTGIGCHEDLADYKKNRVFLNNYGGHEDFIKDGDLKNVVTMHPFKKEGQMTRQHGRFEKPVQKAIKKLMKATSKE